MSDKSMDRKKKLIQRDLFLIRKLHQKTDYTHRANIKATYHYATSKDLLNSKLGEKYLNRLQALYEGSGNSNSCIICGKRCEDNPVLCMECQYKLSNAISIQKNSNKAGSYTETYSETIINSDAKPNAEFKMEKMFEQVSDATTKLNSEKLAVDLKNSQPNISYQDVNPSNSPNILRNDKHPGNKMPGKTIGIIIAILIILSVIASHIIPNLNYPSSSINSHNASDTQKEIEPWKNTEDSLPLKSGHKNKPSNTDSKKGTAKNDDEIRSKQDTQNDFFPYTENELMSRIQNALAKYDLDIGTKKGYSHLFYLIKNNTAYHIAYQTVLNKDGNVQTISVNILEPFDKMDQFSQAVVTAILTCDPKRSKKEVNSIIESIKKHKLKTVHGISYYAGALTSKILTYCITKAPLEEPANNSTETKSTKSSSKTSDKPNHDSAQKEDSELTPLLGMTSAEIRNKWGSPLITEDNIEYYSDSLSIVYENGKAYKIILGLDERYDFTQLKIPDTELSIQKIHLNDKEAAVRNMAKDSRLFFGDGVFYGNTYQIKLDGYFVNVDYYTLQNVKGCPVYRIVLTRLLPVQ